MRYSSLLAGRLESLLTGILSKIYQFMSLYSTCNIHVFRVSIIKDLQLKIINIKKDIINAHS